MSKCSSCARGPNGVEGHLDLFVSTMSGSAMQFKCQVCGALWTRRQGIERLEWNDATGGELGTTLPQRARG